MIKPRPLAGRPAPRVAALALLLAVGLSGCGVAGADFHPGVAAQVGDESITVSQVDSVASSYCSAITNQLQSNNQVLPMNYLRTGVASRLTLVAAAKQFAADKGVSAGAQYDQKVAQLHGAVTSLPQDQQDAVITIESSADYITGVEQAVGKQELKAQGTTKASAADEAAAGKKAFSAWLADQSISIDPQFGLKIEQDQTVPTDTSISYALSDTARSGAASTPDQTYAAGLPASNRCG